MPLYVRTLLVTGPPDQVALAAERHVEHLRALDREGKLQVAGTLTGGDGFVEILRARDRLEADRIARDSPLVESGLAAWTVREWTPLDFGGGEGET